MFRLSLVVSSVSWWQLETCFNDIENRCCKYNEKKPENAGFMDIFRFFGSLKLHLLNISSIIC